MVWGYAGLVRKTLGSYGERPMAVPTRRTKQGVKGTFSAADVQRAIKGRKVVGFFYYGSYRIVEPFCLGVSQTGKVVLRAYQTGGGRERGSSRGWRLFDLEKVSGFRTTGQKFESVRPDYNPADRQMKEIYCHV